MKKLLVPACTFFLLVLIALPATASPTISSISPATVSNDSDVTVTIVGSGFNASTTAWLETPYVYQEPLTCSIVRWVPTSITCRLPTRHKAATQYNLWVNTPFTDPFGNYHPQDVGTLPMSFRITPGTGSPVTPTTTLAPANGNISVSSVPSGANVYIDNEYKGLTPLTMRDIGNGNHVILVRLSGYQDWKRDVVVIANSQSLFATLVPLTTSTTPTPMPTVPTTSPVPASTAPTTRSPIGIGAGVLAIIGAALWVTKRG